jgi:selenocysteine-specific translation elongation factor
MLHRLRAHALADVDREQHRPHAGGARHHRPHALVRALTGIETDRLKEEQERGVSIVPGFALLPVPGGEIDLVDLPCRDRRGR